MSTMETFRWWAFWRRVQYGTLLVAVVLACSMVIYQQYFFVSPTCFDGLQNGAEQGIDCDGSCVRICASSVNEPRVVWAKSFPVVDGQYNAVAYIENRNIRAGAQNVSYRFRLLDRGDVIAEVEGVTDLPPNTVVPLFAGRVRTEGERVPTETELVLAPIELWQPATIPENQFRVTDLLLRDVDTRPRLTVQIENNDVTVVDTVEVVATIFDREGTPLTSSKTDIDRFLGREKKEVVFTWPRSIARTVRSCEIPSDVVLILDRSGSMAADGGDPPEPLESAKLAAMNFVEESFTTTQFGLLSYATNPSEPFDQVLTSDRDAIKSAIANITMGTDGVQYTNTGDAFKVAMTELMSERHRANARKVIVFMTDGDITRPVNPETNETDRAYAATYALEAATTAKAGDIQVYTIGFGDFVQATDTTLTRDRDVLRSLASDPSLYFEAPTVEDLAKVYEEIAVGLCEEGPTRIEVTAKSKATFVPLR